MPTTFLGAVGLVAMLAAAANTPIAAAVMAMELLPGPEGVYATLAALTASSWSGTGASMPVRRLASRNRRGSTWSLAGRSATSAADPFVFAKAV
jgi:H+/Cl- antiporter ClcA